MRSDSEARMRRCAAIRAVMENRVSVDFGALLAGTDPVVTNPVWHLTAPHLKKGVDVEVVDLAALEKISSEEWTRYGDLAERIAPDILERLIEKGFVLRSGDESPEAKRDGCMRTAHWHHPSAHAHTASRWSHNDSIAALRESRLESVNEMVEAFGPPPPHFHCREDAIARFDLGEPARTPFDDLLGRRATCRNFDLAQPLSLAELSTLLKRVFGVHGTDELAPGAVALKKNHPSGGGLHPTEAYLLVQRVEGLATGLYHYNVEAHALDLLRATPVAEARSLAMTAVAGQEYFADAPVLVVMAARFARSMWKYRNHPKIYRAILLEMGHISQNLYLTATEMNLGAFITAAINEVEIEQAFGLEPMTEGPLAVCGFGVRAQERVTVEFDPAHKVWS